MQANKKICITVPDLDEKGYGIDGNYTRKEWQKFCKRMLLEDRKTFIEWQQELLDYVNKNGIKSKDQAWEMSFYNGSKKHKEIINSLVLDFTDITIEHEINLDGYHFKFDIWFGGATFNKLASFRNSVFEGQVFFLGTTFNDYVIFECAHFHNTIEFDYSIFISIADFTKCRFKGIFTNFENVEFQSGVLFEEAEFDKQVSFEHALFEDNVVFTGKQYSNNDSGNNDKLQTISDISFSGAHFKKRAHFENRDFRGMTNFGKSEGQPTRFDLAPLFYNSKLFQGTTFVDTEFKTSKNDELAAQAFNTLKQLMSQQQSVRDEQFLIKKELDIELLKATGGVHLLYWLYKNISDYGFSVKLPFIYLILIPFTIFCLFYGLLTSWINCKSLLFTYSCQFDVILIKKTIEFSLIQGLPLLGLEKLSDALREDLFKNQLSSLTMIVVLQKLFALPGWFLIALALRNLFKMK